MAFIWDYFKKDLGLSEEGQIKLLERMVNYGPEKNEKIPLDQVKKYWHKLQLFPRSKKLMELLIWKKLS
ncbi:MAG: hypothetical protein UR52_C0007G0003 [Candidatus Gottesmanbacteria bacterium GW2011_GWA1_34_13]|uniref:Uncharacterized protein n=1 Tax=Candidatus Gottesmanbacteria bacterium GW2011_GWA1_34_13 TaxID=1618434 RepID=A0A0G0AQV5_9BACT|nr:MAG: hypothetical protein UR52_C0007G0003 [Candidatus Gottesmanbacteria bacterium GW2011_GWA1_34_13]